MLRIRMEEDRNAYRCCFCCHVTTGTILLGLWHLVIQMTVLVMFFVMVMHPELELPTPNTGGALGGALRSNVEKGRPLPVATPAPVSEETKMFDSIMSLYLDNNSGDDVDAGGDVVVGVVKPAPDKKAAPKSAAKTTAEDKCVGAAVTACSLVITVMLIYGTARGRPGYLMPFFCLQAFDFCISCLTVVGYLSYMPDIKAWIKEQPDLPYREKLLQMPPQSLDLLAISFFFLVVVVKAYFLGVVWSTYKYLATRSSGPDSRSETIPSPLYFPLLRTTRVNDDDDSDDLPDQPEGAPLLPPKYEDAIKAPKTEAPLDSVPPPPPYTPFAPGLF